MKDETNSIQAENAGSSAEDSTVNGARRRFARAGLAAPVIMSLASQPVWGNACSVSGFNSGNASNAGGGGGPCEFPDGEGCTPGFWKNHPEFWPAPWNPGDRYLDPSDGKWKWDATASTPFSSVFSYEPALGTGKTLMEVLWNEAQGNTLERSLDRQAVAALLNATDPSIDYGSTWEEVVDAHEKAVASGRIEELKDIFDGLNNMGCDNGGMKCKKDETWTQTTGCIDLISAP